jgi:hypothetical protein
MVIFDFKRFIYRRKEKEMRRRIENKKITISISLDVDVLNIVNENFANRSKFLEKCIIEELCKNIQIKDELKNKKIIV